MSRKCSLSTQTGKLFIVIRKAPSIMEKIDNDKVLNYCKTFGKEYAFILHDKDVEPVTGEVESKHYHIVMKAQNGDKRLSTHLNDIVSYFGFEDNNGICIEKYDSLEGSLQYLIHKNNPEKTQHKVSEIITNIDKGDLNTYLTVDLESNEISFDRVSSICLESSNIIEVIKSLGIVNYQRYRATIWDIWNSLHQISK